MTELIQILFEGLSPHEDVVHIDEISVGSGVTHHLVEEDVKFCW